MELRLKRTVGTFGPAEVTWQAIPREADADDYSPTAGKVTFDDGQSEAVIVIEVIDDDVPEDLQVGAEEKLIRSLSISQHSSFSDQKFRFFMSKWRSFFLYYTSIFSVLMTNDVIG